VTVHNRNCYFAGQYSNLANLANLANRRDGGLIVEFSIPA